MLFYFTVLALLMATQCLKAQYTPWDIIYCINGGENKSVGIAKLTITNPLQKPGWNLIFNDEFQSDSLDRDKWNRSNPWDDGNGSCMRGFAVNPHNPTVEPGIARISNTTDSFLPGCPYSGGEIKTMSVSDTAFNSFYFYAPGYLETRVKLFNKTGQGAAFWLWGVGTPEYPGAPGPWNEIDIFELNGVNGNIFSGSYHWTYYGKHVSQNQSIYLTDSSRLYDLSSNWTTFGLEWDSTSIKWYVNNLLVKNLDLHVIPPWCVSAAHYNQPTAPFCIRLNTTSNTFGNQSATPNVADFPQSMLVDYVRVYKKQREKAAPIIVQNHINQICATATSFASSDKIIRTRYYPGATYEWSSAAFDMATENDTLIPQPPEKKRIWIKPGAIAGQSYPVLLHTVFPEGYTESDTVWLYIAPGPPALPADNFHPAPIDSLCYFSVSTSLQPNSTGCQFSLDNGSTWTNGIILNEHGTMVCHFGNFKPFQEVQFAFRETNECGISASRYSSIIMPAPSPGCKWPSAIDDSLWNNWNTSITLVSISPNPVTDNLVVKLFPPLNPERISVEGSIIDIHGRCVYHQPMFENVNQLALGHLTPGIYCILIIRDNLILKKITFIKQ